MNISVLNSLASKVWDGHIKVDEFDKITKIFDNETIKSNLPKDNVDASIKLLDAIYELSKKEEDVKKRDAQLHKLNKELLNTVYISGNKLSSFDVIYFVLLHPWIVKLNDKERFIFCNITRWFNFVQNTIFLNNGQLDLVPISTTPPPPEPPKPKAKEGAKEGAKDAATAVVKKEGDVSAAPSTEKKKGSGREKPVEVVKPEDVSRFEIRVGKILEVKKHEAADSLYVEKIDLAESSGPRTIISGLVNYMTPDQMLNRKVLVLCNLKPRNMKGVKSEGMVLCGSGEGKSTVEFVDPPADAPLGELIKFEKFPGEPDKVLKPELLDVVLPELKTNSDKIATFKGDPFKTTVGVCSCKTLANSHIA